MIKTPMDAQAVLHLCCLHATKSGFVKSWSILLTKRGGNRGTRTKTIFGIKELKNAFYFIFGIKPI